MFQTSNHQWSEVECLDTNSHLWASNNLLWAFNNLLWDINSHQWDINSHQWDSNNLQWANMVNQDFNNQWVILLLVINSLLQDMLHPWDTNSHQAIICHQDTCHNNNLSFKFMSKVEWAITVVLNNLIKLSIPIAISAVDLDGTHIRTSHVEDVSVRNAVVQDGIQEKIRHAKR